MTVRLSVGAEADLEHIGDHIAKNNPQRAISFVLELREKCLSLIDTPLAFPVIPRYEPLGIRRRIHGSYVIFYCIETSGITVIHVLNGAMDYANVLDELKP